MREALVPYTTRRNWFEGTFIKTSIVTGGGGRITYLLRDVTDGKGNPLTEHLWMKWNKSVERCQPVEGDRLRFSACVSTYRRSSGATELCLVDAISFVKRRKKKNNNGTQPAVGTDPRQQVSQGGMGGQYASSIAG